LLWEPGGRRRLRWFTRAEPSPPLAPPPLPQAQVWPNYEWLDLVTPLDYKNWAAGQPDGQFCAGATSDPPSASGAWSWSDQDCKVNAIFMCEILREWLASLRLVPCSAAWGAWCVAAVQRHWRGARFLTMSPPCPPGPCSPGGLPVRVQHHRRHLHPQHPARHLARRAAGLQRPGRLPGRIWVGAAAHHRRARPQASRCTPAAKPHDTPLGCGLS
jgi:hypothetical protein